jgi:uncharacterized protein YbbC (DUF1343 family)/CubicO group peptidase (beta-lactamase class C family)
MTRCYDRAVRASLALAVVLVMLSPALTHAAPTDFSDIEMIARQAVDSEEFPGAVVLVGRGRDILYLSAFGRRALVPDPAPMTPGTIFDIASLTKPLATALAVMSLVERGAVSLDAPLGAYVSEFRGPAFGDVTIRRLLTHSAGFPAIVPDATLNGGFPRAARALAHVKLDSTPGVAFQYSDVGFILLGEVVRRVSGTPLDVYLETRFFKPMGLRDTTFRPPASVRDRIAPTERFNGHMLQGAVHDPRARILGGVAGHAGMFSTAPDLARLCQMLVQGGVFDGRRYLRAETIRTMWTRSDEGNGTRALGWDMISRYASGMAPFFAEGSVGHTGFTGTSVWIDPMSRAYLIILTNRVHPVGGGAAYIREFRSRITAAAGAALFAHPPPALTAAGVPPAADELDGERSAEAPAATTTSATAAVRVKSGLDVLAEQGFSRLAGLSVGLVTNQTGLDARGRRGIDLVASAPRVRLKAIFAPEHGITGQVDEKVPHGRDTATGAPIWSLYGPTLRPSAAMLQDVDIIVFDIQDVGARYYTYLTTLVYVMEAAAARNIAMIVLDRPNPITGLVVEGPLMDRDLGSFTAPHTIPVRPGMTIGEFARMAAAEKRIGVRLTVVPLEGWERRRWYDETGLPWTNPSPNIRSGTQALLYSGIGLLEATNLSVGRGTDMPFEVIGAPWIDAPGLAATLNGRRLAGIRFEPISFTPAASVYARVACNGIRMVVTDREALRPVTVALTVAETLRLRHRAQFKPEAIQNLLVNRSTMWAFLRGDPLDRILAWANSDRSSFLNRRASYLIYK